MKLIIDAYNVLKQISSRLYITERERAQFIKQLVAYADQKNISIIVVFDGVSESDQGSVEQMHRVTVVYAGHATQADLFIQKYVAKFKEHEFLLVSSDRALCASLDKYQVESIDALSFYKLLQDADRAERHQVSGNQKAVKRVPSSGVSPLDALMEEASREIMVKDVEEHESGNRASSSYTPSKKERALIKKIKKL